MNRIAALGGLVVAAVLTSGCLQAASRACEGGGLCPPGLKCSKAGEREICVAVTCGNGVLDPGERCDDGNNVSGDGCPADCGPACGDGVVDPGEMCDDGDHAGGLCGSDCRFTGATGRCGDGVRDRGEACDDGNLDSQDGCSSRCTIEAPIWTATDATPDAAFSAMAYDAARGTTVLFGSPSNTWEWDGVAWQLRHPRTVPPVSAVAATMVYDAARQRVLMFSDFSGAPRDSWEWDGGDWTVIPGTTSPPPRQGYGLAYDGARHRVVLFGGGTDVVYDATWEWDGAVWREITTPAKPAPRAAVAMTYDSKRGRVVLFGGADTTGIFFDTWEYDGTTWTRRATSGPPRSFYPRMVYDPAREKVVLFGGLGNPGVDPAIPYTWEWDGSQWTEIAGMAEPPPRLAAALTYDLVRREVLLFGGKLRSDLFSPLLNDTWTRSGATWRERPRGASPLRPPPRTRHAMAYEDRRTTTALFGGRDGAGAALADTWVWNGSTWEQPTPAPAPAARAEHAMAYDADRDRTVLFGGVDGAGQLLDDTWEWDGAAWRAAAAPGPAARTGHAMVYDAARRQLLLFGGTSGDVARSDLWAWDGAGWTELVPDVRPPARTSFAMAYDPARARVVVFGGLGATAALRDTWEWDGVEWTDRTPRTAFAPAARSGHTLVYDAAQQRVVLFGGHSDTAGLDDVWTWDGTQWARLSPGTLPGVRQHHAMVSDPARRTLVMFGGEDLGGALGDLWLFSLGDPAVPREACSTGFDGDGDGQIGCADPDCGALCASCGDGVCSAFESCALCPADCGDCQLCGDLVCVPGETCATCPGDCGACP
jgi:cysteine-rich repeat protein